VYLNFKEKVRVLTPFRYVYSCVLPLIAIGALAGTGLAADKSGAPQSQLDNGYRQMYNLDFTSAHETFRNYQMEHPQDPLGHVSNAAAYLFSEFDRLHILEADLFTDDHQFEQRHKLTPDPKIKEEFEEELGQTDALAGSILQQHPDDKNALFSEALANGLRGDYAALIEKRNIASLQYIKTARTLGERLIAIDPTAYDAYLAIGVENYLLGSNAMPIRWMLRMAGAQTDKEEGLQRLRITADKGHYLAPFARLLLAVAALRDKDVAKARILLSGLATQFPHNQLYSKELAKLQ
jgi:hypothetical protein